MKLTVVGCTGSGPGPGGPASCYLVESGDVRLVLDLGNGALGALYRYVNLDDITAVLVSHLHPDHCIDLCSLYVARKYAPYAGEGDRPPLPLYGPAGTLERIAAAVAPPPPADLGRYFDARLWSDGQVVRFGPLSVQVRRLRHPVETYGMRITDDDGGVLAYSADTDSCPQLVELAREADLFLCEAAVTRDRDAPDVHLTGERAGQQATEAEAQRLLLTHVAPWTDIGAVLAEARETYAGPTEPARAGQVHSIARRG